jgi:hypothetical protein
MPFSEIAFALSLPPPSWMSSGEKEKEPGKPKQNLPSAPISLRKNSILAVIARSVSDVAISKCLILL